MDERFAPGEVCLLIDGRGRHYLVTLQGGGEFHYHVGVLSHDEVIGAREGTTFRSTGGGKLIALRPRLADFILRMTRGAQVVYPKDIGPILVWGDIGPGMTVLEAGTGSGALTLALVRAVGESGRVVTVDRREDHLQRATANIVRYLGAVPHNLEIRHGDVSELVADVGPDRLVLDIPEPWAVVEGGSPGLRLGGVVVCYVPTVPQVQQTVDALRRSGCFAELRSFEVLHREWNVEGRSVRPAHEMVGHTGFLTVARKITDNGGDV